MFLTSYSMFYFRKKDALHKKLSSLALAFALLPTLVWLDMMYALFRESIVVPLYYTVSDSVYITVMLLFPILALVFATLGHLKTPKKTHDYGLGIMFVSIVLVVLMALAISPLVGN